MNALLGIFLVLLLLAVIAVVGYYLWKQYMKGVEPSSYTTYYSGFWHYGMLSGVPYEGQEWSSAGALSPSNNPESGSSPTIPSPQSNMNNYQPFVKAALCAGTYDGAWNMDTGGGITAGDWSKNAPGTGNVSTTLPLAPVLAPYSSSSTNAKYFNWGFLDGNLYNEGVGYKQVLVPNLVAANYPSSLPPDTAWPPTYFALTFMAPPTVDNKNYFACEWSYAKGKLKSTGTLQPKVLPDLSYANSLQCTLQIPKTKGSSTSLQPITYLLNAGGLYYVNRSANPMNIGGPCMLVAPTLVNQWYSSINNLSFSLMWEEGQICDVYNDTLTQLQQGGGACVGADNPVTQCEVCYATIPDVGSSGHYPTCQACSSPLCQSSLNKGYVGYWFEFQAPAPNPNSKSSS